MKDGCKAAKDLVKGSGPVPQYSLFYQEFDEDLGTRDVVNLQHVIQAVIKNTVNCQQKHCNISTEAAGSDRKRSLSQCTQEVEITLICYFNVFDVEIIL